MFNLSRFWRGSRQWKSLPALLMAASLLSGAGEVASRPFTPLPNGGTSFATASTAAPQGLSEGLLPADVAVRIAEHAEGGAGEVWRVLRTLGLSDAQERASADDLAPTMLLQWAYQTVEKTEKGAGARLLSAFIDTVAQQVPSIRQDKLLKAHLKANPPALKQFTFTGTPAEVAPQAIDQRVRRVIDVIVDVTASRGSALSPRHLMQKRLRLTESQVVERMLRYGSGKDALAAGLAALPQPPQREVLAEIARDIFMANPAARTDPVLGEAIFRWIGLKHPTMGEWFRYRDRMIDVAEQRGVNAPDDIKENARNAAQEIRLALPEMVRLYANRGHTLNAEGVERMFYEYMQRQPRAAAIWGFAVISMKSNFDTKRYLEENTESMNRRVLGASTEVMDKIFDKLPDGSYNIEGYIRKNGPFPVNGYQEYCRLTGFNTAERAAEYFRSEAVSDAVGLVCPK